MVSERVPDIDDGSNLVCSLVGALELSPRSGAGLSIPFFFRSAVASRAAHTHLPSYPSLVFSCSVRWDAPLHHGFRRRQSMPHGISLAIVVWLFVSGWTTSRWSLTVVPRTFMVVWLLADQAHATPRSVPMLGQLREARRPVADMTVETVVQRIQAQLHVLSPDSLDAGNAELPGGLPAPGGTLPCALHNAGTSTLPPQQPLGLWCHYGAAWQCG
jgi:hypothetical protein